MDCIHTKEPRPLQAMRQNIFWEKRGSGRHLKPSVAGVQSLGGEEGVLVII